MNLFTYITPNLGEESHTLFTHKNIQISRIISSDSLEDKAYVQEKDEWVVILEGEALLEVAKKEVLLKKGEHIFIPALVPHRVIKTQKGTLWLAVYMG